MKYFIDTEFLEGTQDKRFLGIKYGETKPTIDLISIGIVSEDGREYYAISKDFNLEEAWNRYQLESYDKQGNLYSTQKKVYWLRENVLKPIFIELWKKSNNAKLTLSYFNSGIFNYSHFKKLLNKYGKSNTQIVEELKEIVSVRNEKHIGIYPNTYAENVEFYAYYADYDWVAFCWLFGKMIDLPKGFPMYCKDLKQMLDEKEIESRKIGGGKVVFRPIGAEEAMLLDSYKQASDYPKQTNKHNALSDARWNKKLFEFLKTL